MNDTSPSKVPAWSQLLLAAILVALVGGAYWLKSRPKPTVIGGAARQDSTEALLSRGIGEHTAGSYDAALEAYRKILERVCASSFPFPRQVWPLAEQHRVGVIEKFMIQSNHSR